MKIPNNKDTQWLFFRREVFNGSKDLEWASEGFVYNKDSRGIIEFTAVIGGWKNGDELAVSEKLITVINDLMSADDQVKVIFPVEVLHDFFAEDYRYTAVIFVEIYSFLFRIRPE